MGGNDYCGLVEFAPNPKVTPVRENKRKDPKVGTIEQDPDYIKFLEEKEQGLNKDENASTWEQVLEEIETKEREAKAGRGLETKTTPLLQFIKEKKGEKLKKREEQKELRKKREEERKKLREEERLKRKEKEQREKDKSESRKKDKDVEKEENPKKLTKEDKSDVLESRVFTNSKTNKASDQSEGEAKVVTEKDKKEIEKEKKLAREEREKERFRKRE